MIPPFFFHYIISTIVSVLFYCIGHLLLSFLHWGQRSSFHKAFYKVLCGCICATTVFAILKTRFQTTLLVLIPISLYFIYHLYQNIFLLLLSNQLCIFLSSLHNHLPLNFVYLSLPQMQPSH